MDANGSGSIGSVGSDVRVDDVRRGTIQKVPVRVRGTKRKRLGSTSEVLDSVASDSVNGQIGAHIIGGKDVEAEEGMVLAGAFFGDLEEGSGENEESVPPEYLPHVEPMNDDCNSGVGNGLEQKEGADEEDDASSPPEKDAVHV